jgi:hypothetical protein
MWLRDARSSASRRYASVHLRHDACTLLSEINRDRGRVYQECIRLYAGGGIKTEEQGLPVIVCDRDASQDDAGFDSCTVDGMLAAKRTNVEMNSALIHIYSVPLSAFLNASSAI